MDSRIDLTPKRASGLVALALVLGGCGTSPEKSSSATASEGRTRCPREILSRASSLAPMRQVLTAAQRLLAQQTIGAMGRTYHLTPRNAPIVFIAQIGLGVTSFDRRVPGLIPLNGRAAGLCGRKAAGASWAIHYEIPVAPMITSADVYAFFVKTRRGWRFWGSWCGAGKPARWRRANC